MEDLITKISDFGVGNLIDKRSDSLLLQDEEYQKDCMNFDEFEKEYMRLNLPDDAKQVIENYINALEATNCRANEIYYMAGIRDTILFFNKAGLIKS